MAKPNRIFPAWKKPKKGERPPGSYPTKPKRIAKPIVAALVLLGLLAAPVQASGPITGIASWYGPGEGVAMPFCTWAYRHTYGCGAVIIRSLDTGMAVVAPVIDYCQCYVGTPQERIIDLQLSVVGALGLDPSKGLFRVSVEAFSGELPDTAMTKHQKHNIAPHWLEE